MQEYNKVEARTSTLLGILIIHLFMRFVNIHFVRFFSANFGEKYGGRIFTVFVVVLFVDFDNM